MKFVQWFSDFNQRTEAYICNEENNVREHNVQLLYVVNIAYLCIIGIYNIIVPVYFASWGVNAVYQIFFVLQILNLFMTLIWLKGKERTIQQIQRMCTFFHIFVMLFIILISILPFGKEQPAMYFAPVMMGFTCIFVLRWKTIVNITILETLTLNLFSYFCKSREIFNINFYASILAAGFTLFLTYVMCSSFLRDEENRMNLEHMRDTDILTQINNRAAIESHILQYIQSNSSDDYGLVMIDVDYFKSINDNMGHAMGDKVLSQVASVIRDAAGTRNRVGRIGGDEFMIFLHHASDRAEIYSMLEQIKRGGKKIALNGEHNNVTFSIGVCLAEAGSDSYETMFYNADQALYDVKKHGRDGYRFYDELQEGENL